MRKPRFSILIICTKLTIFVQLNTKQYPEYKTMQLTSIEQFNSENIQRAGEDVEMQRFYLNQNQIIFKDTFISKMGLGIKTINKQGVALSVVVV